jgi:predicted amidohydrolase YtcJ
VLSKDIMSVPDEEIITAAVVYTIVGGQVRYQKLGESGEFLFPFGER